MGSRRMMLKPSPRHVMRSRVRRLLVLVGVALLLAPAETIILSSPLNAADGDLDPTFGTGGKLITDFGGRSDGAAAMAIQADGKIVVVGDSFAGATSDFALARYNSNGTLDTTFGTAATGKVTTDFGGVDQPRAVAIQPDGKIVVGGAAGAPNLFALARYNPDGSLDPSFGSGGKVTTSFAERGGQVGVNAVAIQPDGKIVAAGFAGTSGSDRDHALARYNPDGTLDPTFGTGGKVITSFNGFDEAAAMALQADGKIVTAGFSGPASGSFDFALARLNPDGSLDPTFGTGGKVIIDFGGPGEEQGRSVAVQPDGKIVVAGISIVGGTFDFALARLNPDGSLDPTFGTGGKVTTDFGSSDGGSSVAIQPDGKIVVAGFSNVPFDFALARYNPDGSLDPTFGTAGKVTTDFGGSSDAGGAVAIQADGKIVAAGYSNIGGTFDFALSRYLVTTTIEVAIDIKPGSFPNSINLGSEGNVPVAILSTVDFDATTVDPLSVTLASAPVRLKGKGTPMASFEDVNLDGLLDLVVHVDATALALSETDVEAVLEGETFGGTPIQGVDTVKIVP